MQCQICGKREATVHYTEMKEDKVEQLHLCEECARERGFGSSGKGEFSISDLLGSMAEDDLAANGAGNTLRCGRCGTTYAQFRSSGRLGCPECFQAFRAPLIPLLRRVHGSDEHMGKIPISSGEEQRKSREIRNLKKRLDRSIRLEEFEEAARLRDEIRRLEGGNG
jgi:protein arginine kinase activator